MFFFKIICSETNDTLNQHQKIKIVVLVVCIQYTIETHSTYSPATKA